jgi:cytochrome c biogenesis protein CcdA
LVDVVMLATAFLAGLSTVLSPCGYSLLPALVVYGGSGSKRAVEGVMRFALMAVGALGTLALLTLLASLARLVLIRLLPHVTLVAGAGVVAMALAGKPLGKLRGPLLGERVNLKVLAAGALYALGAAGCTLPTFVVFLAYSALVGPEGSVPLMAAYSAGMLVPVGALVVALSAFGRRALERFSALARHSGLLGRTVLLAAGLYMVYVWFSLGVVPLSA